MKPFNLQEALAGKPVVARDGRAVRIAHFPEARKWKIAAVRLGDGAAFHTDESGKYFGKEEEGFQNELDLFMASEKKEGWINLYRDLGRIVIGAVHSTEDIAKKESSSSWGHVSTVRIEWEE